MAVACSVDCSFAACPCSLLAILGGTPLAVVRSTEGPLVGFGSRCAAAQTIEGNRNPAVDPPETATDLGHPLVKHRPQDLHQGRRPASQCPHETLVRPQHEGLEQTLAKHLSLGKGIREVPRCGPSPAQRQTDQAPGQPLGIAMQAHLGENRILWQQPIQHTGQMLLVGFGRPLLPTTPGLACSSNRRTFPARHEPDSFPTET